MSLTNLHEYTLLHVRIFTEGSYRTDSYYTVVGASKTMALKILKEKVAMEEGAEEAERVFANFDNGSSSVNEFEYHKGDYRCTVDHEHTFLASPSLDVSLFYRYIPAYQE